MSDWYTDGLRHIWLPYTQMKTVAPPLAVASTQGCRIRLADGRELVDGIASWWTAVHGYNHPHIRESVRRQLEKMPHIMLGGLVHEQALTLATRLSNILPGDLTRVFFSESGSVSVEIAMKIALQYWLNKGVQGRTHFLSFKGGYHGDTFQTMSVCDPDEGMHALFAGSLAPQHVVDLPTDDAGLARLSLYLEARAEGIAALLIEPLVQGAGGMRMHDVAILKGIVEAARKANVLVIFDEIFTGFARTGTLFACEAAGVVPDIITLSKALTGGTLPLAATVARQSVFDAFWSDDAGHALMHGPTYTGNALACAAANASLDLFEREPRLEQAAAIEAQLKDQLLPARGIEGVEDVRIKGAIGAIALDHAPDLGWLKARFLEEGVWVRPFGRTIYTTPALVISPDELALVTHAMVAVTRAWAEEKRARAR